MNQELPNAPEIEAGIISTLLTASSNIYNIVQMINPECFYKSSYKNIYISILEAHKNNQEIDLINVCDNLKAKGQLESLGGVVGVMELTSRYFATDVTRSCKILYDKYLRRKVISEQYELIKQAYNLTNDITSEIGKSQNSLNEALSNNEAIEHRAHDVKLDIAREISDNLGKFQEVTGVPTGFESYDKRIGGLSTEGDLIILAARPGMGKTTLALNMAQNAQVYFKQSGVFFSLEMSKKQIARILISQQSGVQSSNLRKNKVSDIEIEHIFNTLADKPEAQLFIDDQSNELPAIIAKLHKLKRKHNIKFAIIDYMQLIKCEKKSNREKEIEHISRQLKIAAKVLQIAIIPLCQLSRAVETRGGSKRPMLSDLRDSGAIEQDASVVTFIWRPEYYGIMEDEEGNCLKGVTVLITKKSRFDSIGEDYLFFEPSTSQFVDYDYKTGNKVSADMYDMKLVTMQDMYENTIDNFRQKINEESNELSNW